MFLRVLNRIMTLPGCRVAGVGTVVLSECWSKADRNDPIPVNCPNSPGFLSLQLSPVICIANKSYVELHYYKVSFI